MVLVDFARIKYLTRMAKLLSQAKLSGPSPVCLGWRSSSIVASHAGKKVFYCMVTNDAGLLPTRGV